MKQSLSPECTHHFYWIKWATSWQKPTIWSVHPAKTQISLDIRPVWSESSLSAWKKLGSLLSYPLSAQRRLWSDWAHSHFVGFVMRQLNFLSLWPWSRCQKLKQKGSHFFDTASALNTVKSEHQNSSNVRVTVYKMCTFCPFGLTLKCKSLCTTFEMQVHLSLDNKCLSLNLRKYLLPYFLTYYYHKMWSILVCFGYC